MNELRWIVLAAGVVLVAGIYWWGRRSRPTVAEQPPTRLQPNLERPIPQLDEAMMVRLRATEAPAILAEAPPVAGELPSISSRDPVREPTVSAYREPDQLPAQTPLSDSERDRPQDSAAPSGGAAPESVLAPTKKSVPRRKVIALRLSAGDARVPGAQLKAWLEEAGLQHGKYGIYHRMHDEQTPLFSVASMVEPGTFEPHAMGGMQFPGVTLFLQLPGPMGGLEMVTLMLACARELERKMGGILQDERGLPLTEPRAERLREEVADFLHLLGQH